MSVTFNLEIRDTDLTGFEICDLETDRRWTAPDYESAKTLWASVGADPHGYWTLSASYNVDRSCDLNVSNANARELLELLGVVHDDLSGSMSAADLRGRCLIALALASAVELPEVTERGANGARIIHTHRAASYLHDKLVQLSVLAELAESQGRNVSWG